MAFKRIKKWLERMAEENEKRYGGQKLDCCGMNRQSLSQGRPGPKHVVSEKHHSC